MRKAKLIKIVCGVVIIGIGLLIFSPRSNKNDPLQDSNVLLPTERENIQTTVSTDDYTLTEYSYGPTERHMLDVYKGGTTKLAPIIVMVHGGGWQIGDKASTKVVTNKVDHYIPQGYLFISINYPTIPDGVTVDKQADALAQALTYIQKNAESWGGDPSQMVVMGHSAGAHLVSLVSTTRTFYPKLAPWSGTILLDSAAYDIRDTMENRPAEIFTKAFGVEPSYWDDMSPLKQVASALEPHFVVCSLKREANVCGGAKTYVEKLKSLNTEATLYPVALSHKDVNEQLGLPSDYTKAVDGFLKTLE